MIPQTNKIYQGDCREITSQWDNECIDMVVTSPPYFNLREYSNWKNIDDYFKFIESCSREIFRVLNKGRYVFWNIQDTYPSKLIDKRIESFAIPLSANTLKIFQKSGFYYQFNIVWFKGRGSATQRMFGSYPYPPTFIISWLHENILVFRKPLGNGRIDRKNKDISKITKKEWVEYTDSVWSFNAEIHQQNHPAPFPEELPFRCIKLWSFVNDIVLDPFLGSGTTAVVCKKLNRRYIGIEINPKYCKIAENRVLNTDSLFHQEAKRNLSQGWLL